MSVHSIKKWVVAFKKWGFSPMFGLRVRLYFVLMQMRRMNFKKKGNGLIFLDFHSLGFGWAMTRMGADNPNQNFAVVNKHNANIVKHWVDENGGRSMRFDEVLDFSTKLQSDVDVYAYGLLAKRCQN